MKEKRQNDRLPTESTAETPKKGKTLFEEVRRQIRVRPMSRSTEKSYVHWTRHFIRSHSRRHPKELGTGEVNAFLSLLATERRVSASTQNRSPACSTARVCA